MGFNSGFKGLKDNNNNNNMYLKFLFLIQLYKMKHNL